MESRVYIVTANAADPKGPVNASSGVVSPKGEWLVRVPRTGEHRYVCDIDAETE
jgi:predicted amidohydrolase